MIRSLLGYACNCNKTRTLLTAYNLKLVIISPLVVKIGPAWAIRRAFGFARRVKYPCCSACNVWTNLQITDSSQHKIMVFIDFPSLKLRRPINIKLTMKSKRNILQFPSPFTVGIFYHPISDWSSVKEVFPANCTPIDTKAVFVFCLVNKFAHFWRLCCIGFSVR